MEVKVLYNDKDIVVVVKPVGVASQESHDFKEDMVSLLQKKLNTNDIYVVHRLDQMVSGVMVYALNKEAAGKLSLTEKTYEAILSGIPKEKKAVLCDYLIKGTDNLTKVVDAKTKGAKEAKLKYRVIESKFINGKQLSKVLIDLETGRHHQIRVQFGSRNTPIVGDVKYGYKGEPEPIALAAVAIAFIHPKTKKIMRFSYDWNRDIS